MRSLRFVLGITVLVGVLLVSGPAPQAVQAQWDSAPTLKLVWQSKFPGDAAILIPGDMAIDEWGNVFVTTQTFNGVKKFDSNGNFVKQWGSEGKENGQFALALGIAVDSKNNVYVGDFHNKRIQKFDTDGTFLAQWANESTTSPAFMAFDSQDNLFVDEFPPTTNHCVEKFDTTGKLITEWSNADSRFGAQLEDIALDKDGNLYVADVIMHRVQKLDWTGKLVATFGGEGSKKGNGLFDDPFGVAVDADGNIYVLDSNFLQKLDAKGKFVAQWPTKGGDLDGASKVTVDKQGNLYLFAKADVKGADGSTVNVALLKKFAQESGN
jgi:DNA-binding beta-propeller fold protein YncE